MEALVASPEVVAVVVVQEQPQKPEMGEMVLLDMLGLSLSSKAIDYAKTISFEC